MRHREYEAEIERVRITVEGQLRRERDGRPLGFDRESQAVLLSHLGRVLAKAFGAMRYHYWVGPGPGRDMLLYGFAFEPEDAVDRGLILPDELQAKYPALRVGVDPLIRVWALSVEPSPPGPPLDWLQAFDLETTRQMAEMPEDMTADDWARFLSAGPVDLEDADQLEHLAAAVGLTGAELHAALLRVNANTGS